MNRYALSRRESEETVRHDRIIQEWARWHLEFCHRSAGSEIVHSLLSTLKVSCKTGNTRWKLTSNPVERLIRCTNGCWRRSRDLVDILLISVADSSHQTKDWCKANEKGETMLFANRCLDLFLCGVFANRSGTNDLDQTKVKTFVIFSVDLLSKFDQCYRSISRVFWCEYPERS